MDQLRWLNAIILKGCTMKRIIKTLSALFIIVNAPLAYSVDAVHPTGVNVRSSGSTSVFLTFRGTNGQQSTDAFWCGEITVPANTVTSTNPCVPGTLLGNLPHKLDLSQPSSGISTPGGGGPGDLPLKPQLKKSSKGRPNTNNLTDVMTIPPSVARRAMQSARKGESSSFFYVRKFESQGVEQFIAVTCRMSGGGARVPFALTEVRPSFITDMGNTPVHLAALGDAIPEVEVNIHYNGSGRLKGRWELVTPGEVAPEPIDLLPEASLPIEQRGLQKRYTVIARFDEFLPPNGVTTLKGPNTKLLNNTTIGPYQLLLRIEATKDKEGDSDTGVAVVSSGGVAGFSIPALRYYVATEEDVSKARRNAGVEKNITLLSPSTGTITLTDKPLKFFWKKLPRTKIYVIDIEFENGERFQAFKKQSHYAAPVWLLQKISVRHGARWRVSALDETGQRMARSDWRALSTNLEDNI